MQNEWVVAQAYGTRVEAQVAASALAAEGIEHHIHDAAAVEDWTVPTPASGVRLMVPPEALSAARQALSPKPMDSARGICPLCDSKDIEQRPPASGLKSLFAGHRFKCRSCGRKWS